MSFGTGLPDTSSSVSLRNCFSGTRAADDTNSFFAPGYNLFDIGARYTSTLWSRPVTYRLSVDNLTDRRYWSTIAPSCSANETPQIMPPRYWLLTRCGLITRPAAKAPTMRVART